ncbi:diguanylate cyclase [Pseudomonas putida]|nr:diguanylate cyclase [Pseudomonas putida]
MPCAKCEKPARSPVGAGSPANTGKARAIHPTICFAGNPAPLR